MFCSQRGDEEPGVGPPGAEHGVQGVGGLELGGSVEAASDG